MSRKTSSAGRSRFARRRNTICVAEMLELRVLLSIVTINAGTTIRTVPSDMVGVNTAPWDPQLGTSQTLSLSQAAGLNTVRIGGGSTADGSISTQHRIISPRPAAVPGRPRRAAPCLGKRLFTLLRLAQVQSSPSTMAKAARRKPLRYFPTSMGQRPTPRASALANNGASPPSRGRR